MQVARCRTLPIALLFQSSKLRLNVDTFERSPAPSARGVRSEKAFFLQRFAKNCSEPLSRESRKHKIKLELYRFALSTYPEDRRNLKSKTTSGRHVQSIAVIIRQKEN